MRRGIRLHGELIRSLRTLAGWTQVELAVRAGVSERTVRNAEAGGILELHIGECLAETLGKPLADLVVERPRKSPARDTKHLAQQFETAYTRAILTGELGELHNWLHPEVVWFCMTTPQTSFCGQFQGLEGIRDHCRKVKAWLEEKKLNGRLSKFREIQAAGDLLYLQGEVGLIETDEAEAKQRFWIAKVIRFEEKRVRSVEQFFGSLA